MVTRVPVIALLLLASFIEGAAVMVIELSGAKAIAPYYGTSLFAWGAVVGVTIGALALGYFLGARLDPNQRLPARSRSAPTGSAVRRASSRSSPTSRTGWVAPRSSWRADTAATRC